MSSNNKTRENENKRKRLTQACELCRRKKIKCDGEKPTCGNCVRLNNTCTYSTSSKKRGPRQGYIEMLEQRLAKMEQILLPEAAEKLQNDSTEYDQNSGFKADAEDNTEARVDRENNSSETDQQQQQPHSIVTPNLSTLSNSNDNIPASNSNSVFTPKNKHTPHRLSTDDIHDTNSPTSFSSISSNFPSPPAHMLNGHQHPAVKVDYSQELLPPLHVIEHVVDLFFRYLFNSAPIFDEATLRNDIKERKCPDFLILCLLAACSRFSDRPDIKENPAWHAGESYAEKARAMMIKVIDEPNIPHLQGLLLLALHEYGCGRGPRSWMYTGIVIRMAMELNLHEDTSDDIAFKGDQKVDRLTMLEVRRGLFWSIFSIDKFSSAATGRPSSLPEKFCSTFLPARVEASNHEQYYTENLDGSRFIMINVKGLKETQLIGSNDFKSSKMDTSTLENRPYLNCFAYFIRATHLLSKVTSYVNLKRKEKHEHLLPCHPDSEFYKLNQAIDDLYQQLPPHLKNTPENLEKYTKCSKNPNFVSMHILYNTIIVLFHRPSLVIAESLDNEAVHPELKEFVYKSVKKCMDAVDNVTVLLNEIGKDKELMSPFLTYLTYTVATVVVNASFSPRLDEAQKAKQALGVYFQLLLAARNLWAMADKLYFMVRDLYAIHTNVLRRQMEGQKNKTSQFQNQQQMTNTHQTSNYQQNPQGQQFDFSLFQQTPPAPAPQSYQPSYQQFQQPQEPTSLPFQQFQLQHVSGTEGNSSDSINNAMIDWTLSYYNAAMIYETPDTLNNQVLNSNLDLSLNNFTMPDSSEIFPSNSNHNSS